MKKIILLLLFLNGIVLSYATRIEIDGIKYDTSELNKTAEVLKNNYTGSIVIPDEIEYEGIKYKVTSIGNEAFAKCEELQSIDLPSTITRIGDKAFQYCYGLESFVIPELVTMINNNTFEGLNIKTIKIPENVVRIGDYAFLGCDNLETVYVDGPVEQIGTDAFYGCDNIQDVYIKDLVHFSGMYLWSIYSSPLQYTKRLHYEGKEISNLVIPSEIDYVSRWAFNDCDFLTSVTLPNSIRKIQQGAFSGCDNLQTLVIGENIYEFGDYSFSGCVNLKDVYIYTKGVPNLPGYEMFKDCNLDEATLHVPAMYIEDFKSHSPWKNFKNIVEIKGVDPSPTSIMSINTTTKDDKIYDLGGKSVVHPQKGVYIINGIKVIK